MILVRGELEEAFSNETLHGGVHALSRQAHAPGDLRHGERSLLQGDGAEHLPACGGEPLVRAQEISRTQQQAVRSEDRQDQLGYGFPDGVRS